MPKKDKEAINNVYELPSTKQTIQYLHVCAGYPTKTTWLKAIKAGIYTTWPHLSEKAVKKHFPKSDETHQGHMRSIKQSIRSTKVKTVRTIIRDGLSTVKPLRKHQDIFIQVEEARETIYTDQTGAFLV